MINEMAKPKLVKTKMDGLIGELVKKSSHKILAIWATDCADRVLHHFEKNYPEDMRPREAIEAGRAWVREDIKMIEARRFASASHAAARDAEQNPESQAAARSAGHASATAHVARHAFAASTYAVSSIRDASTSDNEMVLIDEERQWQYNHLLELQMNNNISNNSL
jgi:hypothetical protein